MATLKAKNNQKSIEQFIYRKQYDTLYYPKEYTNIIDFWKTSLLYGKVDNKLNAVMIQPDYLKVIKTNNIGQNTQHYVLNFVADSFSEFLSEVQRADQLKIIPKSKLNPIRITKSTIIPQTDYKEIINNFLNAVFKKDTLKNKLLNINDFLNEFCFAISNTSLYVSQTAYVTNRISSPTISGLIIELSNLEHGTDQPKDTQYLQDPNYQFFINTAEKYSFFVDKNAPWRMVFNLGTDYALQKFKNYNINSLEDMLNKAYKPTYLTDWKILKDILLQYYNEKVLVKSNVTIPTLCEDGSLNFKILNKELITNNVYNDLFWIKLYYYVRLKEENIRLSQTQFENKIYTLTCVYNSSGESASLELINNDTKPFLDGGTNPSYNQTVQINKNKSLKNSSYIYKF
jgi:hypothetical protein